MIKMMNDKPILYQMSKYSGRETDSVEENFKTQAELLKIGYTTLNPIGHSHFYEMWRQKSENAGYCPYPNGKCDVENAAVKCETAACPYYEIRIPVPDYVAHDLKLLEGWCVDFVGKGKYDDYRYQPNVVCVVLESGLFTVKALESTLTVPIQTTLDSNWSNGVCQEFKFAKAHHILVITLETALTVPCDKWSACGL
jgi:hypothetical protein